jgi:hypothetical protein
MTDPAQPLLDAKGLPLLIDSKTACQMLFGDDDRKHFYRLYAMIEREDIIARKMGRNWFIPRSEMEKFLANPR